MRVAICLFGQPRNYLRGYKNIKKFIDAQNSNICFEFYYHVWLIQPDQTGSTFNDRPEDLPFLKHDPDILEKLNKLYKPVSYQGEKQIENFENILFKDSELYKNSPEHLKSKAETSISQCYSRSKVTQLFEKYVQNYDFVLMTRFDCPRIIENIDLYNADTSKIYALDDCPHRKTYAPDHFFICPPKILIKWMNIYDKLNIILYEKNVKQKFSEYGEYYHFVPETLQMSNYYYEGLDCYSILFCH